MYNISLEAWDSADDNAPAIAIFLPVFDGFEISAKRTCRKHQERSKKSQNSSSCAKSKILPDFREKAENDENQQNFVFDTAGRVLLLFGPFLVLSARPFRGDFEITENG